MYISAVFAEGQLVLHSETRSSANNHSWRQKTRDTGLPGGEDRIPLRSFVLTQYRSVTDRRTDGRTDLRSVTYCKRKAVLFSKQFLCSYNAAANDNNDNNSNNL